MTYPYYITDAIDELQELADSNPELSDDELLDAQQNIAEAHAPWDADEVLDRLAGDYELLDELVGLRLPEWDTRTPLPNFVASVVDVAREALVQATAEVLAQEVTR